MSNIEKIVNKKNKIWIYGCSYSDDWNNPRTGNSWWELLSRNYNLEIHNRSKASYGWSFHMKECLFEDLGKWDVQNDLVIVECSHLNRMYSEYLQTRFHKFIDYDPHTECPIEVDDEKYLENLVYITKEVDEIVAENWKLFYNSLKIIDKFSNNWFWWSVDDFNIEPLISEIYKDNKLVFGEYGGYQNWMKSNPKYCSNPPFDIHQTYECHNVMFELFSKQINQYYAKNDLIRINLI